MFGNLARSVQARVYVQKTISNDLTNEQQLFNRSKRSEHWNALALEMEEERLSRQKSRISEKGSCDQTQQASPCQLPSDVALRFRTKKSRKRTYLSALSHASPGSNRVFLPFSLTANMAQRLIL